MAKTPAGEGVNTCRFGKVIALILFAVCWPLKSYAAELTVAWDPPSDGSTTGYILFYGTASLSYSEQVDVGNTTSYAVKNLLEGTTYYFAVCAYDATGVTSDPSTEVSATTAPEVPPVRPVVTTLALSANVASPQLVGTTVTWLATATGGVAPYEFQWTLYGAGRWNVLPWTADSTWTWTPSTPGNDYQVTVAVRSAGSGSPYGEMQQSVPFTVIAPSITAVTIQANVVSPQIPGNTILWSATASAGAAPYQYRWWVYDGNVWSAATAWTTSSTWSWTPTVANGAYLVGVWVRGAGNSTDAPEVSTFVPFPIAPQETAQGPGSELR
jgi:Fibronectin type III domain